MYLFRGTSDGVSRKRLIHLINFFVLVTDEFHGWRRGFAQQAEEQHTYKKLLNRRGLYPKRDWSRGRRGLRHDETESRFHRKRDCMRGIGISHFEEVAQLKQEPDEARNIWKWRCAREPLERRHCPPGEWGPSQWASATGCCSKGNHLAEVIPAGEAAVLQMDHRGGSTHRVREELPPRDPVPSPGARQLVPEKFGGPEVVFLSSNPDRTEPVKAEASNGCSPCRKNHPSIDSSLDPASFNLTEKMVHWFFHVNTESSYGGFFFFFHRGRLRIGILCHLCSFPSEDTASSSSSSSSSSCLFNFTLK